MYKPTVIKVFTSRPGKHSKQHFPAIEFIYFQGVCAKRKYENSAHKRKQLKIFLKT